MGIGLGPGKLIILTFLPKILFSNSQKCTYYSQCMAHYSHVFKFRSKELQVQILTPLDDLGNAFLLVCPKILKVMLTGAYKMLALFSKLCKHNLLTPIWE